MASDRKELHDSNNNPCFFCDYIEEEGWVYSCWIGEISDDLVREGANLTLDLISETGSKCVVNDNRQLTGNWSESNDWLENEYLPNAAKVGMEFIAHVFSPKFITKFSAVDLSTRDLPIIFRTFVDIGEAEDWMRSQIKSDQSE